MTKTIENKRAKEKTECKPEAAYANAVCSLASVCGACSFANTPYSAQLARKNEEMRALFAEIGIDGSLVKPILGMDNPLHYRNKVASPFAPGKRIAGGTAREILTGMYAAGTHKLVDTKGCAVENADANAVVQAIKRIMRKHNMAPYNEDTGAGFVRHVVVRVGHTSGEMLVVVVTNGVEFTGAKNFCRELVKACPKVTTVVQNINMRQTNVILGEESRTLYGPGFILDSLCGVSFRISATSFYQVNAVQTEVLYRSAIKAAALTGNETVIDAYCGTGTIGLVAASGLPHTDSDNGKALRSPGARRVIGVDNVPDAIRDAIQNAKHNGIAHAEFVCADATEFLQELAHKGHSRGVTLAADGQSRDTAAGGRPHDMALAGGGMAKGASDGGQRAACEPLVLLMDPPRSGSTPEFLHAVKELAPSRIVYISCNPRTQVRDIRQLQEADYRVLSVQPVDMFPHTPHVETVVLMSRADK